jgi:hypothetical protein
MEAEKASNAYKTEMRNIVIRTADGSTIRGKVNLGVKERASDLFTRSESPFIIVTDAHHKEGTGKTLFVNKFHIVWAEPED